MHVFIIWLDEDRRRTFLVRSPVRYSESPSSLTEPRSIDALKIPLETGVVVLNLDVCDDSCAIIGQTGLKKHLSRRSDLTITENLCELMNVLFRYLVCT